MANTTSKSGPYSLAYNMISHRGTRVSTILNTPKFDDMLFNLDTAYEYEVKYVPAGYEHRPDLISNVFYGTPGNWWLLMLVNSISDPFEGFKVGERIIVPVL